MNTHSQLSTLHRLRRDPVQRRDNSQLDNGITIIELLIVIALIIMLGAATTPVLSNFLVRSYLQDKTNELVISLRQAQIVSLSGKEDSSWGVLTQGSTITIFKGNSFATRDQVFDQTFDVPQTISITEDEIIFSKITGNPDAIATFVVSNTIGESRTVTVNEVGTVEVN